MKHYQSIILSYNYPIKTLAPVEIKKAPIVIIKECLIPAFMLPSVSFPIVKPAKKPCVRSKYKNGRASFSAE